MCLILEESWSSAESETWESKELKDYRLCRILLSSSVSSGILCRSLDARHAERTVTICAVTAENVDTVVIAAQTLTQLLHSVVNPRRHAIIQDPKSPAINSLTALKSMWKGVCVLLHSYVSEKQLLESFALIRIYLLRKLGLTSLRWLVV